MYSVPVFPLYLCQFVKCPCVTTVFCFLSYFLVLCPSPVSLSCFLILCFFLCSILCLCPVFLLLFLFFCLFCFVHWAFVGLLIHLGFLNSVCVCLMALWHFGSDEDSVETSNCLHYCKAVYQSVCSSPFSSIVVTLCVALHRWIDASVDAPCGVSQWILQGAGVGRSSLGLCNTLCHCTQSCSKNWQV